MPFLPQESIFALRCFGILNQYLMVHSADEAMIYFNRVLDAGERNQVYYSTWRQKLSLMVQLGEWKKAAQKVQVLLDTERDNPEYWAMLIHVYDSSEQIEMGVSCVEQALNLFPEEGIIHIYAGSLCRKQKKYEEAFRHWEKAIALDDRLLDARYAMADCYEELEQYEKAYAVWQALAAEMEHRGWVVEKDYPVKMAQKCQAKVK